MRTSRQWVAIVGLAGVLVAAGCIGPDAGTAPESVALSEATPEQLWSALSETGVWVGVHDRPSESGQVAFVEQRRGGIWIFPIFSSLEVAEAFLGDAAMEIAGDPAQSGPQAFSFPVLQLEATFIGTNDWMPGQLVLDPDSESERVFSAADHDYFRSRAGG